MRWYNESVKDDEGHGCFVINVLVGWGHGRFQRGLKGENYFDVESKKNIVDVPSEWSCLGYHCSLYLGVVCIICSSNGK